MISRAQIFIKSSPFDPFILQIHHMSSNLFNKCIKCSSLHPNVVSTSGWQSGPIRLPLSDVSRGVENGVGNRGAQFLISSTSTAAAILSSNKWHPSNQSMGHSSNKINFTFSSAKRIRRCRVQSANSYDSVRSYSNKASEHAIITETISLTSHSDKTPDVLESNLQDPQRKLPQPLEVVKNKFKFSELIADDFEAETDFVYGGRREEKNAEPYPNAISKLMTHDNGKEAPLPSEVRTGNRKALSHLITTAESCFEVFHIYEQHQNQLNFLHYDLIVKRLSNVIDRASLEEVYHHHVFALLCERLCKNCCQYDPPMLLSLLKMLNSIKLPPDALIMLTTLQMLRKKLDSLDVKELLLLHVLLSSSQQGALGNALKKVVPLALECLYSNLALPTSLSPSHLAYGLFVCANSDGAEALALADKFMMTLYDHEEGVEPLEVSEVVILIRGLLEVFQRWRSTSRRQELELKEEEDQLLSIQPSMSSSELFVEQLAVAREVLLKEALQFVALNFYQLSSCEVEKLQSLLSCAYRNGDRGGHSQELLDAFVRRAVEEDGSIQALATGVAWLLNMDAVDGSLVQALLEKLLLAPSEELCYGELPVLPVIHALAASDALHGRPKEQCHALLDKLLQHPSARLQSQGGATVSRTRLAIDLACLGYFEPFFYGTVLDCAAADARKCLEDSSPGSDVHQFMALWQAQQLLAHQQCSMQVDEKLLSESKQLLLNGSHLSSSRNAERDLVRQLLQHALSSHGSDSVVTRVHTRHAVMIDHVLVLRGSGEVVPQPAAAEGQSRQGFLCLDDLIVPDGSRVLGVVQVGPGTLLNNYSTLRPLLRLELQLLAAEGVKVVPVIMPKLILYCRNEEEKLGYVLETLRQHGLCL